MRYAIILSAFVATALAGDWDAATPEKTTSASWPDKTSSAEWSEKTSSAEWSEKATSAEWSEKATSAEWPEKTTSAEWPDKTNAEWPSKTEETHSQITPTWEAHPHPPPPKVDCKHVKECTDEVDKCRTKPEANQAECSSEYADCLGFNPLNPEADEAIKQCEEEDHKPGHNETRPKPPPIIVSGASSMAPLGIFSLLAAAAAALL
ncbi:uncharacterized protein TrAtP1_004336 [Trichoderma atroviride]|uniref:uncharacterized protein n=1 Tax=Hypocrea atroviridis TaxID=63577 RepID=UPI0033180DA5|nr:hypothetical protein TrAtP1_004336 [Trichoderma atroviride]